MIQRRAYLKRSGRIKPKARTKGETQRIYGDDDRQRWLRGMPCLGCARMGSVDRPHHLHHVKNGGMGKKAGASSLVPLCAACHGTLHSMGRTSFEQAFAPMLCGRTLAEWAATYDDAYRKFSAEATR